tara:strand:- start:277 stop:1023 length:747 start_codon:yes stop_codon:yes gene_type:complete
MAIKESKKFAKAKSLNEVDTHYCSGCGHGIVHHLITQVIDELNMAENTIAIAPVGCAVIAYDYWAFDSSEAAHGRTLAVATGIKRCQPDKLVFSYQGDGDLASIGLAETIHAANRGENISCIFINNACYGMTGGQMAPTTLVGQKTATTPKGRDPGAGQGWPLQISEMLAKLNGVKYVVRSSVATPAKVKETYNYIKKAFTVQLNREGFSLVEILSSCPTVWRLDPVQSNEWINTEMVKQFPLGVIKE